MRMVLIAAQSLDGFITRGATPGVAWASGADQRWFQQALAGFKLRIMGRATYETVRDQIRNRDKESVQRVIMTRRPQEFASEAMPGAVEFTNASPQTVHARLAALDQGDCALLGGAQIHALFLQAGLVDELWLTLEPRLFGSGTPLVGKALDLHWRLSDVAHLPNSDSLIVKYHQRS